MDLLDLVRALLGGDTLGARQWVQDAARQELDWSGLPKPERCDVIEMAVAAGLVEMLAARSGRMPPPWAAAVEPAPQPVFLARHAETMPRLRRLCVEEGPEPLRRRNVLAPPNFLTAA